MGSVIAWRGAILVLGGALAAAACSDEPTVWNDDMPGGAAGDASSAGSSNVAGSSAGLGGSGAGGSSGGAGASLGGSAGHRAGSGGGAQDGGAAGSPEAGSGGDGGTSGAAGDGGQPPLVGGAAGDGGAGGEPPVVVPVSRKLGASCLNTAQCGAGLECLTATSTALGGGAPPHGVCSKACEDDDACNAISAGALCFPFGDAGTDRYCMEGCSFGAPGPSAVKCHDRTDFSCMPALLGASTTACSSAASCEDGEVCLDGLCQVVFAACLPTCRGDLDCAAGRYCDQTFLGGTCVAQKTTGKKLGEPCTVPAENQPAEPDECIGFCQPEGDGTTGHCSATCGIGNECAWDPDAQKFGGACLYASALTSEVGSFGDFGFCTPACNCTAECNDPSLACTVDVGALSTEFVGPGLCFDALSAEDELELCK